MFLHLENGIQENMAWMKNNNNINKKIKIKLKKNQPILEAPPFLARKAEIPEVLETLWQCNS